MRSTTTALVVTLTALAAAGPASAATLSVDDDRADCPAATYTSIQSAITAAAPGDTVTVCAGDYAEGSGAVGTSALTIAKSLTLKGAGADLVTISPVSSGPVSGQIMEAGTPDLRNGLGDVIAVTGTPTQPLTVDISGVTVDGYDPAGRPVAVEAGIVFLDAKGSVVRSRITNVVTSEGDNAFSRPGGYRGGQPGVGIAQVSAALLAPGDGTRVLNVERTRVDKYNKVGVLISSAQNDDPPFTASGAINAATITGSQVIGRTQCVNFAGTGNCASVGLLTTGPLFGQDGIRATAGGRVMVNGSLVSQNLVNGEGAPTRSTLVNTAPQGQPPNYVEQPSSTNNANLRLGAGVRLAGASLSSYSSFGGLVINSQIKVSNIVDNAYGALNLQADGVSDNVGNPNDNGTFTSPVADEDTGRYFRNVLRATNNWWGINAFRGTSTGSSNPGPRISPTANPPAPENPVNGTSVDANGPTGNTTGTTGTTGPQTSNAVDVFPYRAGTQADPTAGEYRIADAPIPVADLPPSVALRASAAVAARGAGATLTAEAADDFGVKSVRFSQGATTLGTVGAPPYRLAVTLPADAACDSTVTFTATATDSLGQSVASSTPVTATCATGSSGSTPAAPSLSVAALRGTLSGSTRLTFTPTAPAGLRSVVVLLGSRKVCSVTAPPFSCTIVPTGADVGRQAVRVILTDVTGATAEASSSVRVAALRPRVRLAVRRQSLSRGRLRRTITGTLIRPAGVTAAQGCSSGRITVVLERNGRSISNQQLALSRSCTFTKRVTGPRAAGNYTVSVRFGGNAVLRAASTSRRFS